MMNGRQRIAGSFKALEERQEKGLISYITAGFPSAGHTLEIAGQLARHSDLLEIGIPFSDPVADGPVIQNASHQALQGGIKMADIFRLAEKIRSGTDIPLLFMTYYNPVMRWGLERFVRHAHESGVDGLIVPDLPVEEDNLLRECAGSRGMSLVPLVAPTSTEERIKKISAKADGFVYCVSVTGVTGSEKEINTDLDTFSSRIRAHCRHPLAVGFGISGPAVARRWAAYFDAVVVGSAIVRAVEGGGGMPGILERVGGLARGIKEAIRNGSDAGA
jgi:tryptophan synthase alpha chain